VVIYPLESNDTLHAQIDRALSLVGLAHLIPRLNERTAWEHILSAGEKQRVAIARLLLHRPSIIVLDEATSALHVAGEAELMTLIARALPEATIISVGHRPELHAFHDRRITMARYPNGTKIVEDTLIQAAKTRIAPILPLHNITLASEIELEHASAP
jgi:putative ATP-binding cassette transporter